MEVVMRVDVREYTRLLTNHTLPEWLYLDIIVCIGPLSPSSRPVATISLSSNAYEFSQRSPRHQGFFAQKKGVDGLVWITKLQKSISSKVIRINSFQIIKLIRVTYFIRRLVVTETYIPVNSEYLSCQQVRLPYLRSKLANQSRYRKSTVIDQTRKASHTKSFKGNSGTVVSTPWMILWVRASTKLSKSCLAWRYSTSFSIIRWYIYEYINICAPGNRVITCKPCAVIFLRKFWSTNVSSHSLLIDAPNMIYLLGKSSCQDV